MKIPKFQHISNYETPELYSTHPYRYFTLGRSLQKGERRRDIGPSVYCLEASNRTTCRNADANTGWTQERKWWSESHLMYEGFHIHSLWFISNKVLDMRMSCQKII